MDVELVVTLVGLALLDSVNTSTLFLVMVILLTARAPARSAAAYASAATATFVGLAVGLHAGATAAEYVLSDVSRWLRRITFALLAVWLLYLAVRRLRDRPRTSFVLPAWFTPVTAVPLGVAATVADLPNAFPLFIAVERLTAADVTGAPALLALLAYGAVYATPVAAVVGLGIWKGDRARAVMRRITERFLSGTARRSIPLAAALGVACAAAGCVAVLV